MQGFIGFRHGNLSCVSEITKFYGKLWEALEVLGKQRGERLHCGLKRVVWRPSEGSASISERWALPATVRNKWKEFVPPSPVIIVNGAAPGCTSMWQCRLEFQHSGLKALVESFSKTLRELSRAWRITHTWILRMSLISIWEGSCMVM